MQRRTSWLWPVAALLAAAPAGAEILVSGRLETAAGQPLADAPVRLMPARDSYQAGLDQLAGRTEPAPVVESRSDEDGRFELRAPAPGLWEVRAAPAGFVPMLAKLQPLVEETFLPAASFEPDRPLTVTVRQPGGEPAAGAVVRGHTRSHHIWSSPRADEGAWSRARCYGITDADGRVELPRADGERLEMRAFAPGFAASEPRDASAGDLELRLRPGRRAVVEVAEERGGAAVETLIVLGEHWWAAGRTDEAGRLAVALPGDGLVRALTARGAQDQARADDDAEVVSLVLSEPTEISGRVIAADHRGPIADALIWATRAGDRIARTDDGGRFRLATTRHGQIAHLRAAAPGHFPESVRVSAAQEFDTVIALRPAAAATGRVVDADGGPVAGAEVVASFVPDSPGSIRGMGGEEAQTSSGEGGAFRLTGLTPGLALEVRATADGFAPAVANLEPIEARQTLDGLRLVLTRGTMLSGRVMGSGEPLADAEITAVRQPETSSARVIFARERTYREETETSDGEGSFEYRNLVVGSYRLRISAPGYASLFLPGVRVEAGGADLGALELEPGVEITGVVVDGDDRPVEGAEVYVSSEESRALSMLGLTGERAPLATSDAGGAFVVPDRRRGERVELQVSHGDHQPTRVTGVVAPTEEPVRVVLRQAGTLAGGVFDATGGPVANATVMAVVEEADDDRPAMGVRGFRFPARDRTDDTGHFRLEQVATGTVRVTASAEGWLTGELSGLEVAEGDEIDGLRLVLERGATVTGQVLDGEGRPAVGASVRVERQTPAMRFMPPARTTTNGDGRYVLEGVEPGLRMITARDRERNAAAREIEVTAGINRLDLRFPGGVEVSGRVVDSAGSPLAGAGVMLLAEARSWSGDEARSRRDGSFTIDGVRDGQYQLRVTRDGHATRLLEEPLQVAGSPISGLEVVLETGGEIRGRLFGLEESQFPLVTVTARADGSRFSIGQVSHDGSYRIPNLGDGDWSVRALIPQGPQARDRVTLDPGVSEVTLDLDFASGLVLTGQVLRSGRPLSGTTVLLQSNEVAGWFGSETDHEGRFRIEGPQPGTYSLEVNDFATGMRHREEIEIDGDRDIVVQISTGRIAGRVLDAADLGPLAGATVSLEPLEEVPGLSPWWAGGASSDSRGQFVIAQVAAADYRLKVIRDGYSPEERLLSVSPEDNLADLEILLEPTAGLRLRVLGASGAPVGQMEYAVLEASGRSITAGRRQADETGGVRLPSVPNGSFDLLVSAPGAAVQRLRVEAPGPEVTVGLQPACSLEVAVADLADGETVATLRIFTDDGTPFVEVDWGRVRQEWLMQRGRHTIGGLAAGGYAVEVTTADGRTWQGTARVSPGTATRLGL